MRHATVCAFPLPLEGTLVTLEAFWYPKVKPVVGTHHRAGVLCIVVDVDVLHGGFSIQLNHRGMLNKIFLLSLNCIGSCETWSSILRSVFMTKWWHVPVTWIGFIIWLTIISYVIRFAIRMRIFRADALKDVCIQTFLDVWGVRAELLVAKAEPEMPLMVCGDFDLELNFLTRLEFGKGSREMSQHFTIATHIHRKLYRSKALGRPPIDITSGGPTPQWWEEDEGVASSQLRQAVEKRSEHEATRH